MGQTDGQLCDGDLTYLKSGKRSKWFPSFWLEQLEWLWYNSFFMGKKGAFTNKYIPFYGITKTCKKESMIDLTPILKITLKLFSEWTNQNYFLWSYYQ